MQDRKTEISYSTVCGTACGKKTVTETGGAGYDATVTSPRWWWREHSFLLTAGFAHHSMYIRGGHHFPREMSVCLKPVPVETPVSCDPWSTGGRSNAQIILQIM